MIPFSEFFENINEALITFGGKAYPRFNQAIILAGGAGSGKGFVLSNLIGLEGKTLDVDALKALAIRSDKFAKKVKEETGHDLSKFDLRKPENVGKLHDVIASVYNLPDKKQGTLMKSILASTPDRKPNLIFDTTLKDLGKLESITRNLIEVGYDKKNIHIVWVVNALEVAIEQNKNRNRVVPEEILLSTHEGASLTMHKVLNMGDRLQKYMDGTIVFAFNRVKVDSELDKSDKGGQYIKTANYVRVKDVGRKQLKPKELSDEVQKKIKQYTPDIKTW